MSNELKAAMMNLSIKQTQGLWTPLLNSIKTLKVTPKDLKLFYKWEGKDIINLILWGQCYMKKENHGPISMTNMDANFLNKNIYKSNSKYIWKAHTSWKVSFNIFGKTAENRLFNWSQNETSTLDSVHINYLTVAILYFIYIIKQHVGHSYYYTILFINKQILKKFTKRRDTEGLGP